MYWYIEIYIYILGVHGISISFYQKAITCTGEKKLIHHISGQIIATSHDLTPNGGLVSEIPLFQGNLGWRNIIIWPDICDYWRAAFLPTRNIMAVGSFTILITASLMHGKIKGGVSCLEIPFQLSVHKYRSKHPEKTQQTKIMIIWVLVPKKYYFLAIKGWCFCEAIDFAVFFLLEATWGVTSNEACPLQRQRLDFLERVLWSLWQRRA